MARIELYETFIFSELSQGNLYGTVLVDDSVWTLGESVRILSERYIIACHACPSNFI